MKATQYPVFYGLTSFMIALIETVKYALFSQYIGRLDIDVSTYNKMSLYSTIVRYLEVFLMIIVVLSLINIYYHRKQNDEIVVLRSWLLMIVIMALIAVIASMITKVTIGNVLVPLLDSIVPIVFLSVLYILKRVKRRKQCIQ